MEIKHGVHLPQRHQQELAAVFPDVSVLDRLGLQSCLCLFLWLLHTDGGGHHPHGQRTGLFIRAENSVLIRPENSSLKLRIHVNNS